MQKALLKPFHAECPLRYQRPTLEELQSRDVRPYLFGGEQRPSCKNCHTAGSRVGCHHDGMSVFRYIQSSPEYPDKFRGLYSCAGACTYTMRLVFELS